MVYKNLPHTDWYSNLQFSLITIISNKGIKSNDEVLKLRYFPASWSQHLKCVTKIETKNWLKLPNAEFYDAFYFLPLSWDNAFGNHLALQASFSQHWGAGNSGEDLNIFFYLSLQNIFQNTHTWIQIIVFMDWSLSNPWADVHHPRMRKSRLSAGSGP